jgi:hypothetical protein
MNTIVDDDGLTFLYIDTLFETDGTSYPSMKLGMARFTVITAVTPERLTNLLNWDIETARMYSQRMMGTNTYYL